MVKTSRVIWIAGLLLLLSAARPAGAQDFPQRNHEFNFWQPFGPIEWEYYHDLAPFAPADISMFDDGPGANEGFFFKYQRLNLSIDRPDGAYAPWEGDWGWGNRYEIGYMTNKNNGWLLEVFNVRGPAIPDEQYDDLVASQATVNSVALDKTFRLKQFHYGSWVEPFVGLAYMNVRQHYATIDDDQGLDAINDMYGLHGGLRWFKQNKRWVISSEFRYFVGLNEQQFNFPDTAEVDYRVAYAMDLRLEATYEISKGFALNVGYEMLFIPDSLVREPGFPQQQDLFATGVIFGMSWNR